MRRFSAAQIWMATLCWLFGCSIHAQTVEWIKQIGGPYPEDVTGICADQEGNIYITGAVGLQSTVDGQLLGSVGWRDIYLAKFAADGTYQWAVRAGGADPNAGMNEAEWGYQVAYDSISDAVYVCGSYHGYSIPSTFGPGISVTGRGSFLAKYDLDGVCQWMRASYNGVAHDLAFDEIGNVFVAGYSTDQFSMDSTTFLGLPEVTIANGPFLAKYSSAGDLFWAKSLGDQIDGQMLYRNGTLYFVGGVFGATGSLLSQAISCTTLGSGILASLDSACTTVNWISQFDSDDLASFVDAQFDLDGEIVTTGVYRGNIFFPDDTLTGATTDGYESFVAKFDTSGAPQWVVALPATNTSRMASSIAPDNSIYTGLTFSGTLTAGVQTVTATAPNDLAVVRLSGAGAVIGLLHTGAVSIATAGILATSDLGCCIAYPFNSTINLGGGLTSTSGADDVFLAKLSAITSTPQSIALESNGLLIYANPNDGLCTIELPDALHITEKMVLSVFDSKGRLVQQVPLSSGAQGLRLDIRAQAKGVYRVELGDGEQRYSGSIVFE